MRIIDSHFHWWPRSVWDALCKRTGSPRAEPNPARGGYHFFRDGEKQQFLGAWADWFDLDEQFEHMDKLGHEVSAVGSIGPFSVVFSELPKDEGRDLATLWNEEMAGQV